MLWSNISDVMSTTRGYLEIGNFSRFHSQGILTITWNKNISNKCMKYYDYKSQTHLIRQRLRRLHMLSLEIMAIWSVPF